MTHATARRKRLGTHALRVILVAAMTVGMAELEGYASQLGRLTGRSRDPWLPTEVMPAQLLAERLVGKNPPEVVCVSSYALFEQARIRGARHLGDMSRSDGREQLVRAISRVPVARDIVYYCGCCDFEDCPNVRAAYALTRGTRQGGMGILYLPTNLQVDWIGRGLASARKG